MGKARESNDETLRNGTFAWRICNHGAAADARYFVVTDTVGNCSVVDSKPGQSSGLKIVGDKGGYSSSDAASKVLKDMTKKCKGVVE